VPAHARAYKGSAPALADLLARPAHLHVRHGHPSVPQIRAGKLRRVRRVERQARLESPEVPTMQEAGIGGFRHSQWQGVLAPLARPRIVDHLNAELVKAMRSADVRERSSRRAETKL